jgi:microsomal epoxide hydrolase
LDLLHLPRFKVAVPESVLGDLRRRLEATRWPNQANARPWAYGADLGYMQAIQRHWLERHDWRAWERRINAYAGYQVSVEGKLIHFIVEPGSGENPLPLLLLHGWPGSMLEFLGVIDQLAHPERFGGRQEDAFTVIVPSLPGFGFSEGFDIPVPPREIARRLALLMTEVLCMDRYALQGGDWGAIIGSWIALDFPERLVALHHNSQGLGGGHSTPPDHGSDALTSEELDWLARNDAYKRGNFGYWDVQGNEPQTLAYGLTDSPIGLAAWILQRFQAWTQRGSDKPPPFDLDHLIANVMMYWLAGINVPNWLYVSLVDGTARRVEAGRWIEVPSGFLFGPSDNVIAPPRRWLERVFSDIRRYGVAPRGGHFLAFEQPDIFVTEMRRFFAIHQGDLDPSGLS